MTSLSSYRTYWKENPKPYYWNMKGVCKQISTRINAWASNGSLCLKKGLTGVGARFLTFYGREMFYCPRNISAATTCFAMRCDAVVDDMLASIWLIVNLERLNNCFATSFFVYSIVRIFTPLYFHSCM